MYSDYEAELEATHRLGIVIEGIPDALRIVDKYIPASGYQVIDTEPPTMMVLVSDLYALKHILSGTQSR